MYHRLNFYISSENFQLAVLQAEIKTLKYKGVSRMLNSLINPGMNWSLGNGKHIPWEFCTLHSFLKEKEMQELHGWKPSKVH